MEDIVPGLLEEIRNTFVANVEGSDKIKALYQLIQGGNATYADAEEYAYLVGEALSQAFGNHLSAAALPDGRMYYNIADRVLRPLLEEDHTMVADAAMMVQTSLNQAANIGLKAQSVAVNTDRIDGIIDKVSNAENYDDVAWVLDAPVKNFSMNVVDEILKANVNFQGSVGLYPKVIRKAERKCCKWCSALAGEYEYPDVPHDVYRRHENCRCIVEYDPGDGRRQNVHNKTWTTQEDRAKIEQRKNFSASPSAKSIISVDSTVADAISNGIVKDGINRELQKPHCEPPKEGKSYLYGGVESAEALYRKLSTTGTPLYDKNGNWTHKERVANDEPVGVWVDTEGNGRETKSAMIVYSKTGSHIYPRKEE